MRLLHRWLVRLTDRAMADSIVGDLEELRRTRRRVWGPAVAILGHLTLCRLRELLGARGFGFLRGTGDDLRDAARGVRRARGFAAAAVLLVALGIGTSTAIFSVAHGVAFQPLPYPDPDRIIRIFEANPASGKLREDVSEPAFHEWRQGAPSLEAAALLTDVRASFLEGQEQQPVVTMSVSPAFFRVLGVQPALGPGFRAEADYTRATRNEVVISHAAWVRLFGRDPNVIGRTLSFVSVAGPGTPSPVVGVMPETFSFEGVEVWRPLVVQLPLGRITRNWRYDRVIARVGAGATIEQARVELETVAARLARDFPPQHGGWTVTVDTLHASTVGTFRRVSWMLLATVAVVLVVTCVNVGGLLVARAVARERDTAVRAAVGASRWRLARLRLCEAALIAGTGAAAGVLLAWAGVGALKAAAPPGIPRLDEVALDLRTLGVAALATVCAVVVFSVTPAGARRVALAGSLRAAAPGSGGHRTWQRLRTALTVTQCAGAAALVVLSMLLARSFVKLTAVDMGWQPEGVVSVTLWPPMPRELTRPWFRYIEWSDRLVARLEATPGVTRAAITTQIPLGPQPFPSTIARGRGKASPDATRWPAFRHNVTDGYFDTMRMRVVAGRTFERIDRFTEPQANGVEKVEHGVVVVSESTANTLWPGQSPIGQALWFADGDSTVGWREVIGVVADINFEAVGETPGLHLFVPWTQFATGNPRLVVKTSGDAAAAIPLIRRIVDEVEPGTRIAGIAPLETLFSTATAQPRLTTRLVGAFGSLALVLAAVGIYGTLSYLVSTRRREIGIRLALGARPSAIMASVLRRGVAPALGGALAGLGAAVAIARVFRALLFHVEPVDPFSVAAGAAVLALVAVTAALIPALRAARVDPTTALRSE